MNKLKKDVSSFEKLKVVLRDKLGVSSRHLNRLVAQEAGRLPGTREEAVQSLCHRNEIPLNRYLNAKELSLFRKNVKQNAGVVVNVKPGRDLNMAGRDVTTNK